METTLAVRLRALRKGLSLTSEQVVKKLKGYGLSYSEQSIYKWEQGNSVPSLNTLNYLSKIYQCNISYLIEGKTFKYLRLSPIENAILNEYRTDFFTRSIITQIIKKLVK